MVSFIVPFASNDGNLSYWKDTDTALLILTTINCIKNINKIYSDVDKEIIIVDNTNTFPDIKMDNLKVIKGWQYLTEEELRAKPEVKEYNIENFTNQTMWASMAYNLGIKEAKGDYICLQHNDIVHHQDFFRYFNRSLKSGYKYISADNKKIALSAYSQNKEYIDKLLGQEADINPRNGGYINTVTLGLADAYFFYTKKEFFDDYSVDWGWNDTNHGATFKCIENDDKYIHLGPFYDNPNFNTPEGLRTYKYKGEPVVTHLKGGFSENKLSYKIGSNKEFYEDTVNEFLELQLNHI